MTRKIFINYRRGDDPGSAGRLFDRLEQAFEHDELFMDVDSITPGLDFVKVLDEQVAQCDIFLAIIGEGWLHNVDAAGQRRLDNPADFVRIEIESALKRRKRVIPVLVNDAQMPRVDDLPESLTPLTRRHAVRLSHDSFRADSERLIRALKSALAEEAARREQQAQRRREARERRQAESEARRQAEEEQQRRETEERRQAEAEARRRAKEQQRRPQWPKDRPMVRRGMAPTPDAFLSYTRFDDRRSKIADFRTWLSDAVEEVSGHAFEIFQDVEGIGLGQKWKVVLDEMLDQACFFIPILTPKFFNSTLCRDELSKFLELERKTGRQDLVLPIYWITCPVLEEGHLKAKDELAQAIDERQRWDWRDRRFKAFEAEEVQRDLAGLASQIEHARRNVLRIIEKSREVATFSGERTAKLEEVEPAKEPKRAERSPPKQPPKPQAPRQEPLPSTNLTSGTVFRDLNESWSPRQRLYTNTVDFSVLTIGLRGEELSWSLEGSPPGFLSGDKGKLEDWALRYGRAVVAGNEEALFEIGREMFDWLDESGKASTWAAQGDVVLEIHAEPLQANNPMVDALLDAPWEVLAREQGFLAAEPDRLFSVARRVVPKSDPLVPDYSDLALMFMAAAPKGQGSLDYEAEEVAILEATRAQTGGKPLAHVVVEESGCVDFLGERLALDGPFEIGHLSCHGDIDKDGPFLALETDVGELDMVTPNRLIAALGDAKPPLMFVSACGTGELQGRLATQVANVVGWNGSVLDHDATIFAETFYKELSRRQAVTVAAAQARRALFQARLEDAKAGQHWHLARVYLGPGGGGPLCANSKPARKPANLRLERAFLDAKGQGVPVATRAQFVGRRRQIQQVFRAWRDGASGVLVHGMGNLGKSSLAARVASRLTNHETVVVYDRYDALSIFEQIETALPPQAKLTLAKDLPAWRETIKSSPLSLGTVLTLMLEEALNNDPILLIIDDLERALVDPTASAGAIEPKPIYRDALAAVLRVFAQTTTASRLLLTSRYRFTLEDGSGGDLASALAAVQLRPMEARERDKQWQAAARAEGEVSEAHAAEVDRKLLGDVLQAAAGNPGLQEILTRPLLAEETEVSRAAAEAVRHYRATGEHPSEENAAHEFFTRVSFETYAGALTSGQKEVLTAATLFAEEVPVPLAAIEAAAGEITVADVAPALDHLLVLGLLDSWGEIDGHPHAALNPLARPLADALDEGQIKDMAKAAMPALTEAWRRYMGDFPWSPLSVEAARLALIAQAAPEIVNATAEAATSYLFNVSDDARSALELTPVTPWHR